MRDARSNPTIMTELLRLFGEIALSRKGPQDLPASPLLLALTVAAYAVVAFGVNLLLSPAESWRLQLLVEVAFTLAWYAVLLRAFGKPERFLQTATAMFGYQLVLAPPFIAVMSLTRRFTEDSAASWQFPVAVLGAGARHLDDPRGQLCAEGGTGAADRRVRVLSSCGDSRESARADRSSDTTRRLRG